MKMIIFTHIGELPNSSNFCEQLTRTLGSLMTSSNSFKRKSTPIGASINGVPIYKMGGDAIRMKDNVYELTPEIHKALSPTSCNGENMKKDGDILMINNIINDIGYTGIGDKKSKRENFLLIDLLKLLQLNLELWTKKNLMIYLVKEQKLLSLPIFLIYGLG